MVILFVFHPSSQEQQASPAPMMLKHVRKRPPLFWAVVILASSVLSGVGSVGIVYAQTGWGATTGLITALTVLSVVLISIGLLLSKWR